MCKNKIKLISDKITLDAKIENSVEAMNFIDNMLKLINCSKDIYYKVVIIADELFSNISNYSFPKGEGKLVITYTIDMSTKEINLSFIDGGIPFNPLTVEEPSVIGMASERKVGGLGIHIVKSYAEDLSYEYKDGCNIITVNKKYR